MLLANRSGGQSWSAFCKGRANSNASPTCLEDLPENFVPREIEYAALKKVVLSQGMDGKPVALATALRGAGGYSKTTLANYRYRDPDVRFEFTDGIVRVDIGKERSELAGLVTDLIEKLDQRESGPALQTSLRRPSTSAS